MRGEAGARSGAGTGARHGVEGRDGLALLVEGGGLYLLLGLAGEVHLHADTLLLPPGTTQCYTQQYDVLSHYWKYIFCENSDVRGFILSS